MLKKAWIKYLIRKNEKNRPDQGAVDFSKSKNIGLIYCESSNENREVIDKIIDDLRAEGKEISTLALCKKRDKTSGLNHHFDLKDISLFGGIKSQRVSEFLAKDFDFVLCYDHNGHYLINYILTLLKSKCRIGINKSDENKHLEMVIKARKDVEITNREVLKYMKMIHSNE